MSQKDLDDLRAGVLRYQALVFPTQQRRFEELSGRQSPKFLFIACSDSRIDPQTYTQSQPGELFVLRNAGNLISPYGTGPAGDSATIEFAIRVLKVRHIIVAGHSDCGAMKALLNPVDLDHLPEVRGWLKYAHAVREAADASWSDLDPLTRLRNATQYNTLIQINHLRTLPCVSAALQRGELQLHASYYEFGTGQVWGYSVERQEWVSIVEQLGAPGIEEPIEL
ncbi:carbonic anhydrase [Planctomicrobium sp. SH664]|uniref:carbonic anhydrase n=1 Tax=Planctomicrobium sp. SH664 TaxID=3448125 RepID=UPI003F5B2699